MTLEDTADAKKERIDDEQAWQMIQQLDEVYIGKGKKVLSFKPDADSREDILKAAMGRSGSLRAPTIKTGKRLFVGYNEAIYTALQD